MPSAIAVACSASPSTRSATPERPSERSAAHTGMPRARRDISGTLSSGSPCSVGVDQVAGLHPEGRTHRRRVAHDGDSAVVRHVQRLVRVGGPRVGPSTPAVRCRNCGEAAAQSPKAPSTCTHAPCSWASVDALGERVERAGVQVAGLQRDDHRPVDLGERGPRAPPAGCGPARRRRPASAHRAPGSAAPRRRWSCRSAPTSTVIRGAPVRPSVSRSQPARVSTSCRPAARPVKLAIVAAGHEPDVGRRRQLEQVEQPGGRDLLGGGRAGRHEAHAGVLVPGADQPVRGQCRGQGAADHPAEEPAGRDRHQRGLDMAGEQVDDVGRVGGAVGQLAAERSHHLVSGCLRWHRAAGDFGQPLPGMGRRSVQGLVVEVGSRAHPFTVHQRVKDVWGKRKSSGDRR